MELVGSFPNVEGAPISTLDPFAIHDSVDEDDGAIDGVGFGGESWLANGGQVNFQFDPVALGELPTHVGLVYTDVDGSVLSESITFEAFDASGVSMGLVSAASTGINGWTFNDRFWGAINPGGISAIRLRAQTNGVNDGLEVDHLQYGNPVPEPGLIVGLLAGVLALAEISHRRRPSASSVREAK